MPWQDNAIQDRAQCQINLLIKNISNLKESMEIHMDIQNVCKGTKTTDLLTQFECLISLSMQYDGK